MDEISTTIFDSRFKKTNKYLGGFLSGFKRARSFISRRNRGALIMDNRNVMDQNQIQPVSPFNGEHLYQYNFDPKKGLETEWWYATPYGLGISRGIDVSEVRQFAMEPFVQMVMTKIKKEILNIPWEFVNTDEEDKEEYKELKEKAKNFFDNINDQGQCFNDIVGKMMPDLMEIDAGCWVKYYNLSKELKGVYARDGAQFTKQTTIDGTIHYWYQYSWRQPYGIPVQFDPNEIVYFMMNPRAYKMYGFSPLQSIQQVLQLLIHSTRYNKEFFENNAMMDWLVNFGGMADDVLKTVKAEFDKKYKSKGHITGYSNVDDMKIQQFSKSNRDMEWLEGQKWYFHLVFGVFGLSPAEVGFYDDVNRSAMEGQERVSVKGAIKPYLYLIERAVKRNLLPEVLGFKPDKDGNFEDIPIKFKYMPEDHVAEKLKKEWYDKMITNKIISINEYRVKFGMKPMESDYANNPLQMQEEEKEMRDSMIEQGDNGRQDDDKKKPPKESDKGKPKEQPKGKMRKDTDSEVEFTPLDIVEESESYDEFLEKWFTHFEKKVIASIESGIIQKNEKYIEKSFGDFLQRLFGIINTVGFKRKVMKFIKIPMKEGLRSAEDELGIDIGISDAFNQKADIFAEQELNGYTLPDGKKWHGIKGVTAQVQTEIYSAVRDGVIDKKSNTEIATEVKRVFTKVEDVRALAIARTETNRFVNEGKIQAYMDSGLEGKKQWISHIDDVTSDECRRLNNQIVGLNENFIDEKTGIAYFAPPVKTNCRSTTRFLPNLGG